MIQFTAQVEVHLQDEAQLVAQLAQLLETSGTNYLSDLMRMILEADEAIGAMYLVSTPEGGLYWTGDADQCIDLDDDEVILALYTKTVTLSRPTVR